MSAFSKRATTSFSTTHHPTTTGGKIPGLLAISGDTRRNVSAPSSKPKPNPKSTARPPRNQRRLDLEAKSPRLGVVDLHAPSGRLARARKQPSSTTVHSKLPLAEDELEFPIIEHVEHALQPPVEITSSSTHNSQSQPTVPRARVKPTKSKPRRGKTRGPKYQRPSKHVPVPVTLSDEDLDVDVEMESDVPSQLQVQPTLSSIDAPSPIPMDEDDIVLPFTSFESLPRTPTRLSTPPPRDGLPVTSTPVRDGLPFHMYQQMQVHSVPNTPTRARPGPGHRHSASYSFPTASSTPFSAAPGGIMGGMGMGKDRGVEGDGTFIPTHSRYANSSFQYSPSPGALPKPRFIKEEVGVF